MVKLFLWKWKDRTVKGSSAFGEQVICILTSTDERPYIALDSKSVLQGIYEYSDRPPRTSFRNTAYACTHNKFNTLISIREPSNLLFLIQTLLILTSILTGSIVLMWTLGAEEDRSRCPNWFRWSSSAGRRGCGIGMDFEGEGLGRIGGLRNKVKEKEDLGLQMASNTV